MNIDGNSVIVIGAALAVLGGLWAATRKVARAELALEQHTAKLAAVDGLTVRQTALETRIALLEQSHTSHTTSDSAAFLVVNRTLEEMRKDLACLREDLTEVVVATRLNAKEKV